MLLLELLDVLDENVRIYAYRESDALKGDDENGIFGHVAELREQLKENQPSLALWHKVSRIRYVSSDEVEVLIS